MKRIIIDIEIHNAIEIVKHQKGRFSAFLAKHLMREETIRQEVEKRVMNEIQKNIEMNLQFRLPQEGIKAHINVRQAEIAADAE